ncbi:unnamed protein product [Caretta caretta]
MEGDSVAEGEEEPEGSQGELSDELPVPTSPPDPHEEDPTMNPDFCHNQKDDHTLSLTYHEQLRVLCKILVVKIQRLEKTVAPPTITRKHYSNIRTSLQI